MTAGTGLPACVVCKSELTPLYWYDRDAPIGGPSSAAMLDGYTCPLCGLRYAEAPRIQVPKEQTT